MCRVVVSGRSAGGDRQDQAAGHRARLCAFAAREKWGRRHSELSRAFAGYANMRPLRPLPAFTRRETEDLSLAAVTLLLGLVMFAGLCVY